ncbi:MAG: alpha/beta hydrolase [Bacteroidota bacterium]
MPSTYLNNADIYYEIHGSGPPLLLIAGMSSDSKSWQFILKDLSQHFRLIIFDNRGCGRTTSEGKFSLQDLAGDAISLIDHLGYGKVDVLGHSMGGMIAQELVLAHPDRVNKLVLASSSPKLSDKAKAILDDLYAKWEHGFDTSEWFRLLFRWLFTSEAVNNKKFMDAAIIFALSYPYPQSLKDFKRQVDAISGFNAAGKISNIKSDTLIISGAEDILIPPEESQQLSDISGQTRFSLIEHAAHSVHAEKPKEFVGVVGGFLFNK